MLRRFIPLVSLALIVAACAKPPAPETAPDVTPVFIPDTLVGARVAPDEVPVAPGDCAEAMRRALAKPDLNVDKIPSLVVAKPAPLQKAPRTAFRKDGSADLKADVLIDTLGKPVMKTFTVVLASNTWLATNLKSVLPKWKFSPAELAGCKVPRTFHFMASVPARKKGR
ncbi:MAG TPA: hypothetical protein VGM67_17620 [Gemmatimonadaceae bacterium]|jgi:hypothetical protein